MAKYKAIKRGYDGIKVREIGEEFEFVGKKAGSWMELVDKVKPSPVKAAEIKSEKPADKEVI